MVEPEKSESDSLIGTSFDKRYQILARLGTGATATAYKANDQILQREVAIKIIHKHLLGSSGAVNRFKQEGQTSTSLSHPNIAKVYMEGIASDGRIYLVMDCLEGKTLAQLLAEVGKLTLDRFFNIFAQMIDALSYAHEQGVVHRDIKPSNIVLINEGNRDKAILVDFGIAKLLNQVSGQALTQTSVLLGSSSYMSPEQCRGLQDIDQRSDIYSLACVMFEALTGKAPFDGDSPLDVMYKHLNQSFSKLRFLKDLPPDLAKIIDKCLQKNPAMRYQNMQALKNDFTKASAMSDTQKNRFDAPEAQRRSGRYAIVLFLCFGVIIAAIVYTQNYSQNQSGRQKDSANVARSSVLDSDNARVPYLSHEFSSAYSMQSPAEMVKLVKNWERHFAQRSNALNKSLILAQAVGAYSSMHDFSGAEAYLAKVISCGFSNPAASAANSIATAYIGERQGDKAIAIIDKVLDRFHSEMHVTDKVSLLESKGLALESEQRYKQAIEVLQAARKNLEQSSDSSEVYDQAIYLALIRILSREGLDSDADEVIKHCLAFNKDKDFAEQAHTYEFISNSLSMADRLDKSLVYLQQAIKLLNEHQADDLLGPDLDTLATYYIAKGEIEKAAELYQKAAEHTSKSEMKARWYESAAIVYLSMQKKELANQLCDKALIASERLFRDVDLDSTRVLFYELALRRKKELMLQDSKYSEFQKLSDEWCRRIKLRASRNLVLVEIYQLKAEAFLASKQYQTVISYSDQALELLHDPQLRKSCTSHGVNAYDLNIRQSALYLLKANAFELLHMPDEAIKAAQAVVNDAAIPNNNKITAYVVLARMLAAQKKMSEAKACLVDAERCFQQASFNSDMSSIDLLRSIASEYFSEGNFAEAERIFSDCFSRLSNHYKDEAVASQDLISISVSQISQRKLAAARATLEHLKHLYELKPPKIGQIADLDGMLVEVYTQLKECSKAEALAHKFIGECPPALLGLGYIRLANVYMVAGKAKERQTALEEGLSKLKELHVTSSLDLAYINIELCRINRVAHKFTEAEDFAKNAVKIFDQLEDSKLDSQKASAYYELALLQVERKDFDAACNSLSRASAFIPSDKASLPVMKTHLSLWLNASRSAHHFDEAKKLESRLNSLK
jgi:serine/threonine protein kinase